MRLSRKPGKIHGMEGMLPRQRQLRRALRDYLAMLEVDLVTLCTGSALRTLLEFMHEARFPWMDDEPELEDQVIISGFVRPHYEVREVRTLGLFKRQRRIAVPPGRFIISIFRSIDTTETWAEAGVELEFCVRDFQGLEEFELSTLDFPSVKDFLAAVIREPSFIRANGLPALEIRFDEPVQPFVTADAARQAPMLQAAD